MRWRPPPDPALKPAAAPNGAAATGPFGPTELWPVPLPLAGCATTAPTWQVVDDSRPDGTVQLAFQYGLLNPPAIDEAQALSTATGTCRARGFTGAQPFGDAGSRCIAMNTYAQCIRIMVYKEYQCTGAGSPGLGANAP